jgi:hypothetical protein
MKITTSKFSTSQRNKKLEPVLPTGQNSGRKTQKALKKL